MPAPRRAVKVVPLNTRVLPDQLAWIVSECERINQQSGADFSQAELVRAAIEVLRGMDAAQLLEVLRDNRGAERASGSGSAARSRRR